MPGCECNLSLTACIMKLGNRFLSSDVIMQKCQLSKALDFNKENRCRCQDQFPAKKTLSVSCMCATQKNRLRFTVYLSPLQCLSVCICRLINHHVPNTHTCRRSWRSNAFWCHLVWETLTHTHQWLKQFAKYAHPSIFTPYQLPYGLPETSTSPTVLLGHQPPNLQWHLGSMGIN